jgi:hypothetical protein
MLEKLLDLIKQNAGPAITNNSAIPNDRNDEAVEATGTSIMETLKNALSGGGLNSILSMFGRGSAPADHPVVQQATDDVTTKLANQFGLDPNQAAGIAKEIVPNVMNQMAQKTADPNDKSFDPQDMMNNLSDGKTSGINIQSLLSKFKGGLDKDGDGDVDLQDLKSLLSGGGGGLMDSVKGLFS